MQNLWHLSKESYSLKITFLVHIYLPFGKYNTTHTYITYSPQNFAPRESRTGGFYSERKGNTLIRGAQRICLGVGFSFSLPPTHTSEGSEVNFVSFTGILI